MYFAIFLIISILKTSISLYLIILIKKQKNAAEFT
jgi:hypothetical protein